MEYLREGMSQTMNKYANEMPPIREEAEYELPSYSSSTVIYP
jgi:hypothetical protein